MPKPTSSRRRGLAPAPVKVDADVASAEPVFTFAAAQRFLLDRPNVERTRPSRVDPDVFKLDRIRALLTILGEPQDSLRCVHIAGTKGKGSTCEMVTAALSACGYAVGLFTSPHLVDMRERIRINDRLVTQADFARLTGKLAAAEAVLDKEHGTPSFFELLTAMAFTYFAEQAVDVAVVEVGLGGRLDCTNVINPDVTAVTSIGFDHTELLGDTLAKIAAEKAGIFKAGAPALTYNQPPEVLDVLRETAERVGAPFRVLGKDLDYSVRFETDARLGPHARVGLITPRVTFEHVPVPIRGEHQALNCGLALAIIDALNERGINAPTDHVVIGLARTRHEGRMEQVWDTPRIIADGAHNVDSIRALVRAIGAHIQYDSMVVVFGCAADKNINAMLTEMGLGADKVIFTKAKDNPRAADPEDLARRYNEHVGKMCQVCPDLPDALQTAARAVGRDDLICVTGSFVLAGQAKAYLAERARERAKKAAAAAGGA